MDTSRTQSNECHDSMIIMIIINLTDKCAFMNIDVPDLF